MIEKNRNNLIQVLKQLKVYQPSENIWKKLDDKLSEKENAQVKLPMLPSKEAPTYIWSKLNDALDYEAEESNRDYLKEGIERLPIYRPPINHWYEIEVGLDRSDFYKRKYKRKYILSSAATVLALGLVFSAFMWISFQFSPKDLMPVAEKAMPESSRLEAGELIYSQDALVQLLKGELKEIQLRQNAMKAGKLPVSITPGIDLKEYFKGVPTGQTGSKFTLLKQKLIELNDRLLVFENTELLSGDSLAISQLIEIEKERAEIIEAMIVGL